MLIPERLKDEQGFTLLELGVTLGLMTTLGVGAIFAMGSFVDKQQAGLMVQTLEKDANAFQLKMLNDKTSAITESDSKSNGSAFLTLDNPATPEQENASYVLTPSTLAGDFTYSVNVDDANPESYTILVKHFDDDNERELLHAARYDSQTMRVERIEDLSTVDSLNPVEEVVREATDKANTGLIVLYSLLGLGGVSGGVAGGVHMNRRKKTQQLTHATNVEQWQKLLDKHDDIRSQWSEYELDITRMIDFPVMADVSDEFTVRLHHALDRARRLRPDSVRKAALNPAVGSDFEAAVADLGTTFAAAEMHAKKISWANFTETERKHLRKAKNLLSLASDSGASPAERQSAYKQALRELDGLIVPPQPAVLLLEGKMSLLIEGSKSTGSNMTNLLKPHEELSPQPIHN